MNQPKLKVKQPKLKLVIEEYFYGWRMDIESGDKPCYDWISLGEGKTQKTMLRGAIRNLKKLLADAEKRLEELG